MTGASLRERLAWLGWVVAAGLALGSVTRGAADEWRRVHTAPSAAMTPTPGPDEHGYFPVPTPPAVGPVCGHGVILTIDDDPGRAWPDAYSVIVDGRACGLYLAQHKRIVGMGAVDVWTYVSLEVPFASGRDRALGQGQP